MTARTEYEAFLRRRHGPALSRRSAQSHAGFLLPHLKPGTRLLDLGCGPGSITTGLAELTGSAVGVDLRPGPPSPHVEMVAGDGARLPFGDATFDAVWCCAVMQHVTDPPAVLAEARRVCRPGAIIAVADADWGGALRVPDDPLLERGQEIQERLRGHANPYIGSRLRGLLAAAGFVDVTVQAKGSGGGDANTPRYAAFQAELFEAPECVRVAVEEGMSTASEMAAIARAWRAWGDDPGGVTTGWWFEALGFAR